jgi:AcrR family transcriptional regulator
VNLEVCVFPAGLFTDAGPTPDFAALICELGQQMQQPTDNATDTKILDATLWLLGEIGERRLIMDDISEVSRVSRSTVFRRFGSKEVVLQRLYQREVRKAVSHVLDVASSAPDAVAAIVTGYGALVDYVTRHPAIKRQSRAEPDVHVRLWREDETRGFDFIVALIVSLAHDRPDSADIDQDALAVLATLLAKAFFAEIMIPSIQPEAWSQTPAAADIAALIEMRLQRPASRKAARTERPRR